ncbi:MAG: hypothetical protein HOO00_00610 [Rhodospirillaceae bacterium]|jgi:hypothetical protein|nr:hypothetical protein [Rhodospirillaceae bacterium]MBT5373387.1 hypothetical protein [Rhodospirillaceae bacterium]MBT5659344.1 hypothetical protein [Rhodospirillaceae bacterium]MBT5752910.1 hypothetical protein [Rhodospirillaceae bacterium]
MVDGVNPAQTSAAAQAAGTSVAKKSLNLEEKVADTDLDVALEPPEKSGPPIPPRRLRGNKLNVTI